MQSDGIMSNFYSHPVVSCQMPTKFNILLYRKKKVSTKTTKHSNKGRKASKQQINSNQQDAQEIK